MSKTVNLELTQSEREVLLRGLRYVRSSIMLDVREPEPDDEARRSDELHEIANLADRLRGMATSNSTAGV